MRYYQTNGTFHEDPLDVDFGWFFSDIVIDESAPIFNENNEKIRDETVLQKSLSLANSLKSSRSAECEHFESAESSAAKFNEIEESIDVLAEMEVKPLKIYKVDPNIKIETPTNTFSNQLSVEGFIKSPESNFYKQIKNYGIPSKEEMIKLINPINPESKALLSVVSYSKYRCLNDKETNDNLYKGINFKTTNSKHIIGNNDFYSCNRNGTIDLLTEGDECPDFSFLLNDREVDADQQLVSEIRNYHATKEDNMLSLMMELIITDMDSNIGDMSELNSIVNELNTIGAMETSDLGNSIHSSLLSKDGNGSKENQLNRRNYLSLPSRSDILSSIGLTDDIDRSIENFTKEKLAMHQQLLDIKKCFEEDETKVDNLIKQAISLQNDLREVTYLDNLIHLLNGKLEKVKNKKLPFRMFHKSMDDNETDFNPII